MRFFEVDLHFDIPIEIPIQSDTDLTRFARGLRWIGQLGCGRPGKGIFVICLHAVARHELERTPPSVGWIEWSAGRRDAVVRSVFAGDDPIPRNLPGAIVYVS